MTTKVDTTETKFKSKSWIVNSIDLLVFNLKSLKKMNKGLIIILFFFLLGLMVPFIFVPYYGGVPIYFLTYLIIPIFIILGYTGYGVRNSTLYINLNSSGLGRKTFYFGQILTIFVVGNILSLLFWPIVAIFGQFNVYSVTWAEKLGGADLAPINPFINGTWILIIYDIQATLGITFAVYFCTQSIISNHKTYYIVVTTLILLSVVFGGAINDYFLQSPGGLMYSSFIDGTLVEGVDYVYVDHTYYILESAWPKVNEATWNANELDPYGYAFPLSIFIPTLLFPFFGVGQFASAAIGLQSTQHMMWNNETIQLVSSLDPLTNVGDLIQNNISGDVQWYDWFIVNPALGTGWMWFLVLLQPYFMSALLFSIGLLFSVINRK